MTPNAPPPPVREAATESARTGIDNGQSTSRAPGAKVSRAAPGHLSRRAIESSPTLTFLAGREPDEPDRWSWWWERKWLR